MVYTNNSLNNVAKEDFLVTTATAGADRKLSVTNTDNSAAASAAHVQVTVGGTTSTGDPYTNYLVTGGGTWSIGIDNSDSDKFKLTTGATPSAGSTAVEVLSAGSVNVLLGDFNTTRAQVGASVQLGVTNTDTGNTSSAARMTISNGGAGGGDAYLLFGMNGSQAQSWEMGIDHTAGSFLLTNNITAGTANLTGTTFLTITAAGQVDLTNGVAAINLGADAAEKTITVGNGTGATSVVMNCGTGALNIGTNAIARTTTIGNTTGASALALNCGTADLNIASATGTLMTINDTGEIIQPLQSAFMAFQPSAALNVTGQSQEYTLGTTVDLTEVFDQNADFDPTSGVYTSPVTGRYSLGMSAYANGLSAATTFSALIYTSNRTYISYFSRAANAGDFAVPVDIFCDMDAGDTATYRIYVVGEAGQTADIYGANAGIAYTYCYGQLDC